MNDSVHHIRLLAGLEIEPGMAPERVLDRKTSDELAGHLAADLQRLVPEVAECMLVVAGALLEPAELIRPGFPAWAGLEELARATLRERGFGPRVMAIGAHAGKLPHAGLQPPPGEPAGQMLAIPMTLIAPADRADALEGRFEAVLFERGGISPPARALLEEVAGLASTHGQLLTLADLIALQHVQLDAAGLGGFWPVVESILVSPDEQQAHSLPADLQAAWRPERQHVEIDFLSFDQHPGGADAYALWLRAFRTLTALLDSHAIAWQAAPSEPVVFDDKNHTMIESAGRHAAPDGVTVHQHPDVGLVAWSIVEDGRLMNVFPLSADSANRVMNDQAARGLERFDHPHSVCTDPETGRLMPASTPQSR